MAVSRCPFRATCEARIEKTVAFLMIRAVLVLALDCTNTLLAVCNPTLGTSYVRCISIRDGSVQAPFRATCEARIEKTVAFPMICAVYYGHVSNRL
jgi:hypothetical protein